MQQQSAAWPRIALNAGRILLASLFVLGGFNKIANYAPTLARMGEVGLDPAALLLPLTIALEIGAGLAVAVGRRFAWQAALVLAVFALATNLFFHRFWEMSGQVGALELSLFFKNVSIAGAMFMLAGWLRIGR